MCNHSNIKHVIVNEHTLEIINKNGSNWKVGSIIIPAKQCIDCKEIIINK